jgi:acyl-CoA thioester hydrolase
VDELGPEVWSGCVNPWECDANGHLNVRFYAAKAMEGLGFLAGPLGMPQAFARHAQATLVVRDQHIRFLREARPGMGLAMTAGVLEIGESEARILMVMRHLSGEPAATFQTVVEHVTANDLRPFPWPDRVRARAQALRVEAPAYAAARSSTTGPITSLASLERADALGLMRSGSGIVCAQDCDAFGRVRTEMLLGRISDGVPRVFSATRARTEAQDKRFGGAALEYRLLHFGWPRAGQRVELRSGLAGSDARLWRMVHWLLDADTGQSLGSAEAVAVNLDLETRKIVDLSPEAQAEVAARVTPGLAL